MEDNLVNYEQSLLRYFLDNNDLSISEKHFTEERKEVFKIIKDYFLKNDEIPNKKTFKKIVKDKELDEELIITFNESFLSESLNKDYLIDKIKDEQLVLLLQNEIFKFNKSTDKKEGFRKLISNLSEENIVEDIIKKGYIWEDVEERWRQFKINESGEGVKNKKFHIDIFDKHLLGRSNEQFICFVSLPGVGKTNIMLNMAYNLSRFEDEHCMFVSGELSFEKLMLRIDARESLIDSLLIQAGNLNSSLRSTYKKILKEQYERKDKLFVIEAQEGFTADDIIGWGLRYKAKFGVFPGSFFIDYLWLMDTMKRYGSTPEKHGNIALELRHKLCRKYQVSTTTATQESRGGAVKKAEGKERGMESVSESNKIAPHVNVMIFLDHYKPDDVENMNRMGLHCVKNTYGPVLWREKLFYAKELSYVGDELLPGMQVNIGKKEKKQKAEQVEETLDLDSL